MSQALVSLDEQTKTRVLSVLSQYERVPVSPRQFIEDPYYLGAMVGELHERWKQELEFVLDPANGITQWIITGAVGTGKSSCAAIAQTYKLYGLTCLKDPAAFYGLLPGSRIVFGVFSITLDKADKAYDLIKMYVSNSPYFQEHCPRSVRPGDPVSLPSKRLVVDVGSLAEHALSEDMFGFILDEANFFKKNKRWASESDKTRASQLFTQASRRVESRFMRYGVVPGLACLLSSKKTQTEFLEDRIVKAERDPHVRTTSFALWEVKPASIYCGKTFAVMIGDELRSSRVLDEEEVALPGYRIIHPPIEHLATFEEDIDEAIRDLAGEAVTGAGYFFSQREKIYQCVDRTRVHPFSIEQVSQLSTEGDTRLESYLLEERLFKVYQSRHVPLVDPGIPRFAHVDIGLTNDALGLAIGHETASGLLYYDILLRVRAPESGEVDLDAVVEFFRYLRDRGFRFRSVTYDQYQSKHSVQRLKKIRFNAGQLSIGLEEYKELRRRLYAGAVSVYSYPPFLTEVCQLLKDFRGGPPDHPEGGSKDVADAAAGVAAAVSSVTVQRDQIQRRNVCRVMPVVGAVDRVSFW
jgi:hypothetical protein